MNTELQIVMGVGIVFLAIKYLPFLVFKKSLQREERSTLDFDFKSYQREVVSTRIVKKSSKIDYLCYAALGLCEESGEFAGRLKKIVRDKNGVIDEDDRLLLKKELGDTLWYLVDAAYDLGFTLEEIAIENRDKCRDRVERDVIKGQGDNR